MTMDELHQRLREIGEALLGLADRIADENHGVAEISDLTQRTRSKVERTEETARQGYAWTAKDDDDLLTMYQLNVDLSVIAKALKRTEKGVYDRLFHKDSPLRHRLGNDDGTDVTDVA
jgi:hypothetical protein